MVAMVCHKVCCTKEAREPTEYMPTIEYRKSCYNVCFHNDVIDGLGKTVCIMLAILVTVQL